MEPTCVEVSPALPYDVEIELGPDWSLEEVEELLGSRDGTATAGSARVLQMAEEFLRRRTPFFEESELPEPPEGRLVARFSTLDCITFVYLVHAMVAATNLRELFENLGRIRYSGSPSPSNLIHYTYNSVARMLELGWVRDLTPELLPPAELATRTVRLGIQGDGRFFLGDDFGARGDHNCGALVSQRYIPVERFSEVEDDLESGDTLLLVSSKDPEEYPGIVRHAVFAYRPPGERRIGVLHCGKSRVGDPTGRRAGVSVLGQWDPERRVLIEGSPPRTLQDYLERHPEWWRGIVVLRGASVGSPLPSLPRTDGDTASLLRRNPSLYTIAPEPTTEAYLECLAGAHLRDLRDVLVVGTPPEGLVEAVPRRPALREMRLTAFAPAGGGAAEMLPRVDGEALPATRWDLVLVCPGETLEAVPMSLFEDTIPSVVAHRRRSETVVVVSLPKSGTNLLHNLFRALDYKVIGDGAVDSYNEVNRALFKAQRTRRDGSLPFDFLVSTFGDQRAALSTHALRLEPDTTFRDLGGDMKVGSPLWDWICEASPPVVFNYRDPRDVLVSLVHYLLKNPSKNYWTRATQTVLRSLSSMDERLDYLIRCVPRYIDLYFRQHFWLLFHPAVCKVSFEQLVGAAGGGSEAARIYAVLRIMEHVGFEGDPHEVGASLLSQDTRTFRRGRIGGWREEFSSRNRQEFCGRHRDVLEFYEYDSKE